MKPRQYQLERTVYHYLGIVYEGSTLGIGRKIARGGVFKAFYNCSLASAIMTNDDGQWHVELDNILIVGGK